MKEQLKKLLAAMGMTPQQITELENLKDEDKDWKPDDLVNGVRTGIRNTLLNDNDFLSSITEDKIPESIKKKLESGQYTRFQKELLETATKKLGLKEDDFDDEDRKSIKKLTEKIATKFSGLKGDDKALQKLQSELSEALQKLEKAEGEHKTQLETSVNEAKSQGMDKVTRLLTQVSLGSLDKIKLSAPAEYVVDRLLSKMKGKFNVVLGEDDSLDIKQKDNKALDVMDSHGKKIGFKDALRSMVLEDKIGEEVKEDKQPPNPRTVIVNNDEGGGGASVLPEYIKDKMIADPATTTT